MIPDFVQQTKEILQKLKVQAEATRSGWKDCVADKYYERVVQVYDDKTAEYIDGCVGMCGYGLDDLLVFFDEKERQLQELGPVDPPVFTGVIPAMAAIVNTGTGRRESWSDQSIDTDAPNPSDLSMRDIADVERARDASDRYRDTPSGLCDRCGKPLFRCECGDRRNIQP